MGKKSTILIFMLLGCALVTVAGAVAVDLSVVWNKTYGEPGTSDSAYSIVRIPGGGYVFAGDTESFGAGKTDAWLVGLSGTGAEQWNRTYGDPEEDSARTVINTSDGNFLFAGAFTYVTEENRKDTDVWIVKIDPSGEILWDRTFGGPEVNASASAVIEASDGGYIVAGRIADWGEPDTDLLVIKFNGSGYEQWNSTFGEPGLNDSAYAVVETSSGDIGVAGSTESFDSFGADALVLKLDSSGNEQWNVTFGGARSDTARSIVLAPDGDFVFAGSYMSSAASGGTEDDALVVKMKQDGKVAWNWTYGESTTNESACDIIATLDGGYLFAGRSGTSPLDNDAWVVKLDSLGAVEGELEIGGRNPGDRAASVIQTAASEYVFAGTFNETKRGGTPETDAWIVKLATTRKTGVQPSPKPPKPPTVCPVQCPSPTPKPTPKPAPKTGCIGDYVWNDTNNNGIQDAGEKGFQGVQVQLLGSDGTTVVKQSRTDARGAYLFSNLQPGDYYVKFGLPTGHTFTQKDAGGNDAKDSDADQTTGRTDKITLRAGEKQCRWDAGLVKQAPSNTGQIGDLVWEDTDKDGVQDGGEKGVAGITVNLLDGTGNPVLAGGNPVTTQTDANGKYLFDNLGTGDYIAEFVAPQGSTFTAKDAGGDDAKDSDADQTTGRTAKITLAAGEQQLQWDAGLATGSAPGATAEVRGRVWEDVNGDNIQQREQGNQEPGIPNIEVKLRKTDNVGTIQNRTTTNADGLYQFANVPPGDYYLEFTLLPGYKFVGTPDQGNDNEDSDADPLTGATEGFTLQAGETKDHWDAGMTHFTGEIGGTVWEDDGDGLLEDAAGGDHGVVAGVAVVLMKDEGGGKLTKVDSTATDANGVFLFSGLAPAQYSLLINPPAGTTFTGFDHSGPKRSNVGFFFKNGPYTGWGSTASIPLGVGDSQKQWDVGLVRKSGSASVTGSVDPGEAGRELAHWFLCPPPLNWLGICLIAPILSPHDVVGPIGAITAGLDGEDLFDRAIGVYANNILQSWVPGMLRAAAGLSETTTTSETVEADSEALLTRSGSSSAGTGSTVSFQTVSSSGDADFPDVANTSDLQPLTDINSTGTGVILGEVVNDIGRNNQLDPGDVGVPEMEVQLLTSAASTDSRTTTQEGSETGQITTNVTDTNGTYIFTDLTPGEYYLQFILPPGYEFTSPAEGSDLDPQTGRTTAVEISSEEALAVINVGIAESSAPAGNSTVGDFVWNDTNSDGLQDEGEEGIADAAVELYYANGTLANTTTTDADGAYIFANLSADEYYLVFALPEGYNFTAADQGTDDALDSDADPATGRTEPFALAGDDFTRDAGLNAIVAEAETGAVAGLAWNDTNADGVRGADEAGVSGVVVVLLGTDGTDAGTTTTDGDGAYRFTGVAAGTYSLRFSPPEGYTFSPAGQDSTVDPAGGATEQFDLAPGEEQTDWNAGLVPPVAEETLTPEEEVTPEEEITPEEEVTPQEETTPGGEATPEEETTTPEGETGGGSIL